MIACRILIYSVCFYVYSYANFNQLINNEQLLLLNRYQLPASFRNEFPFSGYEIINSACQGSFYIDTPNHDYIKAVLASGNVWEPDIIERLKAYVRQGSIAIDVGAHIGTHTITMSYLVQENGVVLAFEPQEKIHKELVLNLELNKCRNVIPIHAALGEENGIAYLEPIRPQNEGYRCISSKNPTERISILKLDDLKLSHVSCIKIDTESYELEVLQGAYQTIIANKPVIIIEIGGGWSREKEEGINPQEHLAAVIDMLDKIFNYETIIISPTTGDYLAVPKI